MIRVKSTNPTAVKANAKAAVERQKALLSKLQKGYTPEAVNRIHRLNWDLIKVLSDKAARLDDDEAYFLIQQAITSLLDADALMAEL